MKRGQGDKERRLGRVYFLLWWLTIGGSYLLVAGFFWAIATGSAAALPLAGALFFSVLVLLPLVTWGVASAQRHEDDHKEEP